MAEINRFPLTWPEGWKRTQSYHRRAATFKTNGQRLTVAGGVQRVLDEMEKLGVMEGDVMVSSNVRLRLDGLPRSGEPKPGDPGVCVYRQKTSKEPMRCMAVDRYTEVADNLAAIAATLEAMRAIERHGGAAILDRAFTGFTALPPPAAGRRDWWAVLELGQNSTAAQVRAAHQRLALLHHPDRGGDSARMAQINDARAQALQELGE